MNVLQYSPGATAIVLFQTLNAIGQREDGYQVPSVNRLILPNLSTSTLYPIDMIRIDTGLYYHRFTLPQGPTAIGSYLVDIVYTDGYGVAKNDFVQVVCTSTGGSFSVSPT